MGFFNQVLEDINQRQEKREAEKREFEINKSYIETELYRIEHQRKLEMARRKELASKGLYI